MSFGYPGQGYSYPPQQGYPQQPGGFMPPQGGYSGGGFVPEQPITIEEEHRRHGIIGGIENLVEGPRRDDTITIDPMAGGGYMVEDEHHRHGIIGGIENLVEGPRRDETFVEGCRGGYPMMGGAYGNQQPVVIDDGRIQQQEHHRHHHREGIIGTIENMVEERRDY